jgi:hypothetical protein
MLLSQANAKRMTQELELPQLEVELERAIWQVETAIKKQNETAAQKDKVTREEATEKDGPAGTGVVLPGSDDKKTR